MLKQQTPPSLPILLILLSPLILLSLPSPLISPSLLISLTGRKNKQKNAKNNFFIIFAHIQKTRNL